MPSENDLRSLIHNRNRRLQKLREQQALTGLTADPGILIEIEDIEVELARLQFELTQIEKSEFTLKDSPVSPETDADILALLDKKNRVALESLILSRQGKDTYFWGTLVGMIIGALFCLAGFIIIILGLIGSTEWVVTDESFIFRLSNIVPGVILSTLGMIILWHYKPKVKRELQYKDNSWKYEEYYKSEQRGDKDEMMPPPPIISDQDISST